MSWAVHLAEREPRSRGVWCRLRRDLAMQGRPLTRSRATRCYGVEIPVAHAAWRETFAPSADQADYRAI